MDMKDWVATFKISERVMKCILNIWLGLIILTISSYAQKGADLNGSPGDEYSTRLGLIMKAGPTGMNAWFSMQSVPRPTYRILPF